MSDATASAAPRLMPLAPERTADAVAAEIVAVYRAIDGLAHKVSWAQQQTERLLCAGGDPALAAASRAIAAAIDADPGFYDRHPYHSRQHFCEVMLAAALLCQVHRRSARESQLVLLAALIHDFDHDGKPSRDFRLERTSLDHAAPFLASAGVGPDARGQLAALVLATEPRDGVRAALLARGFHAHGAPLQPRADVPAELAALAHDAALARLAVLLCEADILPSVALTFAHAMHLQDLLALEWGRPLGPKDKLVFLDSVLSAGVISAYFLPNALAIRQALVRRVDAPRDV